MDEENYTNTRDIEFDDSNVENIRIEDTVMNPKQDSKRKREDKAAYLNGKRTSNILFGYNKNKVVLENGTYLLGDEVIEALSASLSSLGENEVVVCKKTGKVVEVADVINEVIREATLDSAIELTPGTDKIAADNLTVNVRGKGSDTFIKKGIFLKPTGGSLKEGKYYTLESIKSALSKFLIGEKVQEVEEDYQELYKDMLYKYYGDSARAKEYVERYKRFISHRVSKDGYETIDDYPEKLDDEAFLHFSEYKSVLERYSKASNLEDFSSYDEYYELLKSIGSNFVHEDGSEMSKEEAIQELIRGDAQYLETNNCTYNQHVATHANLMTLGKHGENREYLRYEKVKDDDGKIHIKPIFVNAGRSVINLMVFGKNAVVAPLHRAVGSYMIAPVHDLLFNGDRRIDGVYKNLITHRYDARKDYFEQMYMKENMEKYADLSEEERAKKFDSFTFKLKYAFVPRFRAITRAKEGNIAVLSAGAHEIREQIASTKMQQASINDRYINLRADIERVEREVSKIERELEGKLSSEEKEKKRAELKDKKAELVGLKAKIEATRKYIKPVSGFIQTDAISLEAHEKANREAVTMVVSGVKLAGRAAAISYLGPRISKYVLKKFQDRIWHPTRYVPTKVPGKMTKDELENLTINDLIDKSPASKLTYEATEKVGGSVPLTQDASYVRGLAFKYDGRILSSSDGMGFNYVGRTTSRLGVTGKSKFFDTMARTINSSTGNNVTADQLINDILSSPDPEKALTDLLENTDVWMSKLSKGMPTGWEKSAVEEVVGSFSKSKTVFKKIPGWWEYRVSYRFKKVVDKRLKFLVDILGLGAVSDVDEVLRRTKSQEELEEKGLDSRPITDSDRNNKGPYSERNTTNEWGFDGTKKGDLESLYSEDYGESHGRNR